MKKSMLAILIGLGISAASAQAQTVVYGPPVVYTTPYYVVPSYPTTYYTYPQTYYVPAPVYYSYPQTYYTYPGPVYYAPAPRVIYRRW